MEHIKPTIFPSNIISGVIPAKQLDASFFETAKFGISRVLKSRKAFENNYKNKFHYFYQNQKHTDKIFSLNQNNLTEYNYSDAVITDLKNAFLCVSIADCAAILLYDKNKEIIAAIHSGWKGTKMKIVEKTILHMNENFKTNSSDLLAFISPMAQKERYEVGDEFLNYFDSKYLEKTSDKLYFDNKTANYDILLKYLPKENIEVSDVCTIENNNWHSYRRDGLKSGRNMAFIAIK